MARKHQEPLPSKPHILITSRVGWVTKESTTQNLLDCNFLFSCELKEDWGDGDKACPHLLQMAIIKNKNYNYLLSRPAQDEASKLPAEIEGGTNKTLPLTKELLAGSGYWA